MDIKQTDQQYIAHTYARFDLEAMQGNGAVCTAPTGKQYVDFSSGIGVNSLGFCDPDWVHAVCRQAGKIQHISNLYYTSPMAELAKILCERTGMKKAFFGNSGAEANECMIKAARKYSHDHYGDGRFRILTLENSFHGRTITTLAATGQAVFHKNFGPFTEGFDFVKPNDTADLATKAGDSVCAIMIELIQGEGGVVPLAQEFVNQIADICGKKDILLLVDEIQTGIGRTGKLLCSEHYGLSPDMISLAKGLGGGLPIGGVLFGEKCEHTLGFGDHGTTYGGNPIAAAGALAVMEKLTGHLLDEVLEKGAYLKEKLEQMPHVLGVDGIGMMLGVRLDGPGSRDIAAKCLESGLVILTAKEKLRLLPPLTITHAEIDLGLKILNEVLGNEPFAENA